ncbi:cytochrome c1 [Brackiella oedipodis]|uniref:cytochrome c1 n=1 Tax=Brackiella oedipodis TaxID=124225 RepID=UPI000A79DA2F
MKKFLASLILFCASALPVFANEGGAEWQKAPVGVNDMQALQNGAKLFVNYCLNCHSANALRYNKLTEIGLTEKQIEDNLLFTEGKVGDLMQIAMRPDDAKKWFGTTPPDLSVMARAKAENLGQPGTDYLYTYLQSFYRDQGRDTGWNNLIFPNVGMPNPLWDVAGPTEVSITDVHQLEKEDGSSEWKKTVTHYDAHGFADTVSDEVLNDYSGGPEHHAEIKYLDPNKEQVFKKDVADLAAFMGWMAEPQQHFRKVLGTWVMLFLAFFFVVAWFLNRTYWKHVK